MLEGIRYTKKLLACLLLEQMSDGSVIDPELFSGNDEATERTGNSGFSVVYIGTLLEAIGADVSEHPDDPTMVQIRYMSFLHDCGDNQYDNYDNDILFIPYGSIRKRVIKTFKMLYVYYAVLWLQ